MIQQNLMYLEEIDYCARVSVDNTGFDGAPISIGFVVCRAWNHDDGLCFETDECHETKEFDEAEVLLDGFVKWDGCSNWRFSPNDRDNYAFHFCTVKQAEDIGRLLRRLYEIAAEMMPQCDFRDELREEARLP